MLLGSCAAFLIISKLRTPQELNIEIEGVKKCDSVRISSQKTSVRNMWKITAVPELSIAIFCMKFVRYCMYMWLPLYLIEHLGYSKYQGGIFSTMFDIGGIIGNF